MRDWKSYARARDQLYNLVVRWRDLQAGIPAQRRTPELVQVLEIVESVVEEALKAFEAGDIMAVQIDHYTPVPLPSFEDYVEELKKPRWSDEA